MPERMREEAKALMEKWPVLRKGEMPVTEVPPFLRRFLPELLQLHLGAP